MVSLMILLYQDGSPKGGDAIFKILVGLLATSGLIGQVFISPMLSAPDQLKIQTTIDWETVGAPLRAAGNDIRDEQLSHYFKNLLQGYGFNTTLSVPPQENTQPDFDQIIRVAMTMPLQEAGKEFTDKELARLYYQLLNDSGWNIKPE
jgi:hypothetical protein